MGWQSRRGRLKSRRRVRIVRQVQGRKETMRDCGGKYLVEPAGPISFPRLTGPEVSWFALYVQVNHENEVVKRLENKELTCFLPLMECWSKRLDRREKIRVPPVPGVRIHPHHPGQLHQSQYPQDSGALTILRNSEGPLPIPPTRSTTYAPWQAPLSPSASTITSRRAIGCR